MYERKNGTGRHDAEVAGAGIVEGFPCHRPRDALVALHLGHLGMVELDVVSCPPVVGHRRHAVNARLEALFPGVVHHDDIAPRLIHAPCLCAEDEEQARHHHRCLDERHERLRRHPVQHALAQP